MRLFHFNILLLLGLMAMTSLKVVALDTVEAYLREYPNQEQTKMMNRWLKKNKPGSFYFTGLVDPSDTTVVTPQATVDYGYNWFSISEKPAIIYSPSYDKFYSVSIFDMRHNIPAVVANPTKPILVKRPGQTIPEGDFTVVELETDQGLVLTRMVVVDNFDEVKKLRKSIKMDGGNGDMHRSVQRFSDATREKGERVIDAIIVDINPDVVFGKTSGDVSFMNLAAGVKLGQLGTPVDTVRYGAFMTDDQGKPLNGKDTYVVSVAPNLVKQGGYFSVTLYGVDNKLLIPNKQKRYDRTTFSATPNDDGSYTLILSPSGEGRNGIPTGKDFYGILRAYVPEENANMKVSIKKQS